MFTLVDSINHMHMGMVAVANTLDVAMKNFSQNLRLLHKEISSKNMPGNNNFLVKHFTTLFFQMIMTKLICVCLPTSRRRPRT